MSFGGIGGLLVLGTSWGMSLIHACRMNTKNTLKPTRGAKIKKTDNASQRHALTDQMSPQEIKETILYLFEESSDPNGILRDIGEKRLQKILHGTDEEAEEAKHFLLGQSDEAIMLMGLVTHYPLLDTVDRRYAALMLTITRDIEKEHQCTTTIEKILAENVAVAHLKMVDVSRRLNGMLEFMDHSVDNSVVPKQVEALSRQADRAHRQLLQSITTLKQLRQPTLEVNIRNAFVAQNQQVNQIAQKS